MASNADYWRGPSSPGSPVPSPEGEERVLSPTFATPKGSFSASGASAAQVVASVPELSRFASAVCQERDHAGGGADDGWQSSRSHYREGSDKGSGNDTDHESLSSAAEFDSAADESGRDTDYSSDDEGMLRAGMRGLSVGGGADGAARPAPQDAPGAGGSKATSPEFSIEEVREAFDAFDSDGDGYLDAEDVLMFFKVRCARRCCPRCSALLGMRTHRRAWRGQTIGVHDWVGPRLYKCACAHAPPCRCISANAPTRGVAQALGDDPSLADIERMIEAAAARGDGSIAFNEFYAMACSSRNFW